MTKASKSVNLGEARRKLGSGFSMTQQPGVDQTPGIKLQVVLGIFKYASNSCKVQVTSSIRIVSIGVKVLNPSTQEAAWSTV